MTRALDMLEAAGPDADRLDMGVITAGVAMTWIQSGGSLSALWSTTYGRLVVTKVGLVVAVIVLAAHNRQRLVPSLVTLADAPGGLGQDPDSDGALDEVTMGEIAAVSLWLALQPSPVETQPSDPIRQQSAMRGRALMESLACTSCHTQHFAVTEPTYVVAGGIGGWDGREGLRVNLHEWAFGDQPAQPQPGAATLLPIWSDLRRHDMGPALADAHDTFRDDAPGLPTADGFATFFGRSEFLTTPLWGIAVTAPYLHDGRAPTIRDAILAHGGEANESLSKFLTAPAADQQAVLDLLDTFTWFEAPLP
mgnify:CR=1 FL=1